VRATPHWSGAYAPDTLRTRNINDFKSATDVVNACSEDRAGRVNAWRNLAHWNSIREHRMRISVIAWGRFESGASLFV
jgi:hypothetical protein